MVRKNLSISSGLSRGNSRSFCFFGLGGRCFCWGGLITVIGAGRGSALATVGAVKAVSGSPPSVLFTNRRTLVSLMMVVFVSEARARAMADLETQRALRHRRA